MWKPHRIKLDRGVMGVQSAWTQRKHQRNSGKGMDRKQCFRKGGVLVYVLTYSTVMVHQGKVWKGSFFTIAFCVIRCDKVKWKWNAGRFLAMEMECWKVPGNDGRGILG